MRVSLALLVTLVQLTDMCRGTFWDSPSQPVRRAQMMPRAGRERPRPLRFHRHIQGPGGLPRRPPPRMHRPAPLGHRRRPGPPPPFYRQNHHFQNFGSGRVKPAVRNHMPPAMSTASSRPEPTPKYFQQDEVVPQASKHFPVTAVATHRLPLSSSVRPPADSQPHGYLSSSYKGWKPIVKPYQSSYHGPPSASAANHKSTAFSKPGDNLRSYKNYNLNTLFREDTERRHTINAINAAFSENLDVRVPFPTAGSPDWTNTRLDSPMASQSELTTAIKKPVNTVKLVQQPTPSSTSSPTTERVQASRKYPKLKFRRPRPKLPMESEEELAGPLPPPPQFPRPEENEDSSPPPQPLDLKEKLTTHGRVRVRTKKLKPYSQKESVDSPPRTLPTFHQVKAITHEVEDPDDHSGDAHFGSPNDFTLNPVSTVDHHPSPTPISKYRTSPPTRRVPVTTETYRTRAPEYTVTPHHHHPHQHQENFYTSRPGEQDGYGRSPAPTGKHVARHKVRGTRRKRPKTKVTSAEVTEQPEKPAQQPTTAFPDGPAFLDDFYFPPGFSPDPNKNTGKHPVSFMTMPGSKPQVIHHTYSPHQSHHPHQLYHNKMVRARPSELDSHRAHEGRGSSPNPNYIHNRPHFGSINVHNRPIYHPRLGPNYHNVQESPAGTIYPSNSNHESSYFPPSGYGHNHLAPFHYDMPYRPDHPSYPPGPPPRGSYMTSTTPKNLYRPQPGIPSFVPYEGPSTVEIPVSEESYQPAGRPSPAPAPAVVHPVAQPTQPPPAPYFTRAPARGYPEYGQPHQESSEYDKIPMQFMDHLKPILTQETSTSAVRHAHHSPEIHPPASFFDDFFQPFDQSYSVPVRQELDAKSSSPPPTNDVQLPEYAENGAYESQKAQPSSHSQVIAVHPSHSSYSSSTSDYSDVSPVAVAAGTGPEISSVDAHYAGGGSLAPSWSKLKEDRAAATEGQTPPGKQSRRKTNIISQGKHPDQQGVSEKGRRKQEARKGSAFKSVESGFGKSIEETGGLSPIASEEDVSDSNTPRSVPALQVEELDSNDSGQVEKSSSSRWKKQQRRRRPGAVIRRRYFSSSKKKVDKKDHHEDGTVKSRRVPILKRRLLHRRRKLLQQQQRKSFDHEASSSPATSTEVSGVTYGESQWFQLKPSTSSEVEQSALHTEKQQLMKTERPGGSEEDGISPGFSSSAKLLPLLEESSGSLETTTLREQRPSKVYSSKRTVSFSQGGKVFEKKYGKE